MTRACAAALLVATATLACAFRTRTPDPGPREGHWAEVRDGATRRDLLYDGVVHRANATVTHLTLSVREARAQRLAEWKDWTDAELERHLAEERAAAAAGEEFVLAFYTGDWKNNDLDAPDSIWHVALHVGDTELLASEIHALNADAELRNLFPWIGPFDVVYSLKFPHAPAGPLGDSGFELELASAVGKVELDYDLPMPLDLRQLVPAPPEQR